jgi:phytanoyl-CoA dioxygenase PhyH
VPALQVPFAEEGYAIVPRLLDPDEVEAWTRRLEETSRLRRADFGQRTALGLKRRGVLGAWTHPDGVSRTRDFWPLVVHQRLLDAVRAVLGAEVRFLQHTDLHVGFSALGWHRDSVSRRRWEGADWDEGHEPYRLVRVGLYLQAFQESRFRLGVIPGTHRGAVRDAEAEALESALGRAGRLRALVFRRDPLAECARWLELGSGDCVLFDPRLLHSGTPIDGPKYSIFLAYGLPNAHFHRHRAYYRHLRPDLGYHDLDPELARTIADAGLLAPPPATAPASDGAYQPSFLQTLLARRLRPPKGR